MGRGSIIARCLVLFLMLRVAAVISMHADHHEWTEQNKKPRQDAEKGSPLEEVGETEKYKEADEAGIEPVIFHRVWRE